MGRKKKNVDMIEMFSIDNKSESKLEKKDTHKLKKKQKNYDSDSNSRENDHLSPKNNSKKSDDDYDSFKKNMNDSKINQDELIKDDLKGKKNEKQNSSLIKKYEKIMIKTFNNSIQTDEKLIDKLYEQYQKNQEVKNIILEMSIRIKDIEYLIKNQWSILKKFNLQESIYMEESKNLTENEKLKKSETFKDTIDKLTAAHINGFEPDFVIKNKIINKIQKKYDLDEELTNVLKKRLFSNLIEDEDILISKRNSEQISILEKLMKHISHSEPFREVDNRNNFMLIKQELKRYEKELELKAGKGFLNSNTLDFHNLNSNFPKNSNNKIIYNNFNSQRNHIFLSEKRTYDEDYKNLSSHKSRRLEKSEDYASPVNKSKLQNDLDMDDFEIKKINPGKISPKISFNSYSLKMNDLIEDTNKNIIKDFKSKTVEKLLEKTNTEIDLIEQIRNFHNHSYKSRILSDLNLKLIKNNSLSEFEIQILVYLSHVVVRDLVNAKINEKKYEGILSPDELIDLIKKFKSDLQIESMKTPFNLNKLNLSNFNFLTNPVEKIIYSSSEQNNNVNLTGSSNEVLRNDDNIFRKKILNDIEINSEKLKSYSFKDVKINMEEEIISEKDDNKFIENNKINFFDMKKEITENTAVSNMQFIEDSYFQTQDKNCNSYSNINDFK